MSVSAAYCLTPHWEWEQQPDRSLSYPGPRCYCLKRILAEQKPQKRNYWDFFTCQVCLAKRFPQGPQPTSWPRAANASPLGFVRLPAEVLWRIWTDSLLCFWGFDRPSHWPQLLQVGPPSTLPCYAKLFFVLTKLRTKQTLFQRVLSIPFLFVVVSIRCSSNFCHLPPSSSAKSHVPWRPGCLVWQPVPP